MQFQKFPFLIHFFYFGNSFSSQHHKNYNLQQIWKYALINKYFVRKPVLNYITYLLRFNTCTPIIQFLIFGKRWWNILAHVGQSHGRIHLAPLLRLRLFDRRRLNSHWGRWGRRCSHEWKAKRRRGKVTSRLPRKNT